MIYLPDQLIAIRKVLAGSSTPRPRKRYWGTFSPVVLGLSGLLAMSVSPESQDVFWWAILLLAAAAFCIESGQDELSFGPVAVAVLSWAIAAIIAYSHAAPLLPVLVAAAIASYWAVRGKHREIVKKIGGTAQGAEYAAEQGQRRAIHLLAAASHDLRQPVQALLAQIDFIGSNSPGIGGINNISLSPRQFKEIQTSVNTLAEMLNDLLDVNRVNMGIGEAKLQPVNVRLLLQEVEQIFAVKAKAKGLRLLTECPEAVWIKSNPKLLRRILFNLTSNAIRYTDTGEIQLRCLIADGRVLIQTQDTGRGMNVTDLAALGTGLERRPTTSCRGLGLGLGIVRTMTHHLGHTLRAFSRLGEGTQIEVELGERIAAVPTVETMGDVTPPVVANISVAIVEDDAAVLHALADSLTSWGCRTVAADSGHKLEVELRRVGLMPMLVIADLNLESNETGLDVIRALRKRYGEAEIPAIILTGDVVADLPEDSTLANVRVLHKPVRPSDLRKLVSELVFVNALKATSASVDQRLQDAA